MCCGVRESIKQELAEGITCHIVVLDLACLALVIDVVGRVCDHQVGLVTAHQQLECLCLGTVAANQAVSSQFPEVSALCDGRVFKLTLDIEVVVMYAVCEGILEQVVNFRRLEAGERNVEVLPLQVCDEQGELVLVPVSADLVQRNIECFFLFFSELYDHAGEFGMTCILEDFQSLVPAYHTGSALVPDHRFHVAELLDRALELLIFRISGFEILAWIVVGRQQLIDVFLLNCHVPIPP